MIVKQLPLSLRLAQKGQVRTQFGAICYKISGHKVKILLVTTRGTGRWIVPKGWPIHGMTPERSAAREAWEEAGVIGQPTDQCMGMFAYCKEGSRADPPAICMVYPVRVEKLSKSFPEKGQRRRKWFSPKKAAAKVAQPELARMLREFDPRVLH